MTASSAGLTEDALESLLQPYILPGRTVPPTLYGQLATYLELLVKWNARTNLTAIRSPDEIVRRHFGESLFAAQHLDVNHTANCETLLDFGSGAGFPGLPIQLLRPDIRVTLAESQNKKAAFLREAVRTLGLKTGVWAARVEAMPSALRFDVVTLRAVDNMEAAVAAAAPRVRNRMLLLTTAGHALAPPAGFAAGTTVPLPGTREQQLIFLNRIPGAGD
jgi:16S rRNA (guanine527-N7)-methyltransferase